MSDGRWLMGTVLELTVVSRDEAEARRWLDASFDEVEELESLLSRWNPRSELSGLNDAAGQGAREIDERLARVLRLAIEYSALTRGSFDVSVGPLVELWTGAASANRIPSEREVAAARALVGSRRIRVETNGKRSRAALPEPGMSLDLGAIAKGFALDRLRERARSAGHDAALLSFGQSSAWALGAPPGHTGWNLLLRAPNGFSGVVRLRDRAFSVSSTIGKTSEIEGRRFGHVVDPRSGWALERTRQAAVVAPTAALAEALSTALVVLEEGEGIALVEELEGCEAMLVDERGRSVETNGWRAATGFEVLEDHVQRLLDESLERGEPFGAGRAVERAMVR